MGTCEEDEAGLLQKTSVESLKVAKTHSTVACDCNPDCAGCGCSPGQNCNINGEQKPCPSSGYCQDAAGPLQNTSVESVNDTSVVSVNVAESGCFKSGSGCNEDSECCSDKCIFLDVIMIDRCQ